MEILPINEAKLKVLMTEEDMHRYGLVGECIDCDTAQARKIFWSILDEAKKSTGFDVAKDKVLVQLYPSKDGGCELFVTKLGILSELTEKTLARSGRVAMLSVRYTAYRFEFLCDLTAACAALHNMKSLQESDVYYADDGYYYLVFEERVGKDDVLTPTSCLREYGECVPPRQIEYVREHGICIKQGDAASLFARL